MSLVNKEPKLRDGYKIHLNEPYPLGELSDDIIRRIGAHIIYILYTGRTELFGNDWADIFAESIGGTSFNSPIGIADVGKDRCGWSMKTVKTSKPFKCTSVRLISGRCSPDFSYGIENPHDDVQRTGDAVLAIFNSRVQISYKDFNPVRTCVLVRNYDLTEFTLFETELHQFNLDEFKWHENRGNNFIGTDRDGRTRFSWQPHGSQFTIHENLPANTIRFRLRKPKIMPIESALNDIGFDETWVDIIK